MSNQGLTAEAKVLITNYLFKWFTTLTSLLIIVFGVFGTILFQNIEKSGQLTAESSVEKKLKSLDKIRDKFIDFQTQATQTIANTMAKAESTKLKLEQLNQNIDESKQALKDAKQLVGKFDDLTKELVNNSEFKAEVTNAVAPVPGHAVLAFNSNDCPAGWTKYNPAKGRVIIGAGKGKDLTERKLYETGGEEVHKMQLKELAPHSHKTHGTNHNGTASITDTSQDEYGKFLEEYAITSVAGGGDPFNIMQPWVALLFCEKQ